MIGETTDFTTQAIAFGYLGLSFGAGTILGPLMGGALSQPCDVFGAGFPLCGKGQLFEIRCNLESPAIDRLLCHPSFYLSI